MSKLLTIIMMVFSMNVMASVTQPNEAVVQSDIKLEFEKIDYKFQKKNGFQNLDLMIAEYDGPLPSCYGNHSMCNFLLSQLASGNMTSLPAGCRGTSDPASNIYFCELK